VELSDIAWLAAHDDLESDLSSIGLTVETTTFDPAGEGYLVVAGRS